MNITIVGSGRMGKILAAALVSRHEVALYDADRESAASVAGSLKLRALATMAEAVADAVVLAVPDKAVASCVAELARTGRAWNVFSVATNISREMLAGMAGGGVRLLNVKIIGHAGEMSRGSRPVLVIDRGEADLVELARQVFAPVGALVVGAADQVQRINSVATAEALRAAVAVESGCRRKESPIRHWSGAHWPRWRREFCGPMRKMTWGLLPGKLLRRSARRSRRSPGKAACLRGCERERRFLVIVATFQVVQAID